MNNWIQDLYDAPDAAHTKEAAAQQQASLEFFAKVAADNGINLETLSPEQINHLWTETWKLAEAEAEAAAKDEKPKDEPKKDEKSEKDDKGGFPFNLAKAKEEHEAKKEAAAEEAHAEHMGSVMAHSFIRTLQEQDKLAAAASAMGAQAAAATKTASSTPASRVAAKLSEFDKAASAVALELAASNGIDADAVADRLAGLVAFDQLADSTKIASVQDPHTALQVRALELLEQVGVPVDWSALG